MKWCILMKSGIYIEKDSDSSSDLDTMIWSLYGKLICDFFTVYVFSIFEHKLYAHVT